MGSPQQIGQLGLGSTVGGSLLSAGGAISSGIAGANQYQYQAGIAKLNQQLDKQNEEFARQEGEQQASQFGIKAGQQMGQIKASQASAGFDVRSGSDAQIRTSQRTLNTIDTNIIRSNAAKTAYNYEIQGNIAGQQASMYSAASKNAMAAGFLNAGSSVLGGVSSVSSQWLKGQQTGLWGSTDGGDTV